MRPTKVFSVFLSSAFLDMQAERDYLKENVFSGLDAWLMPQNARLRVVDLRGSEKGGGVEISTEEAVFMMCLEGIDNCRPRLIGLLGDRYGWVPYGPTATYPDEAARQRVEFVVKKLDENKNMPITVSEMRDKSITHIEILYGLKQTELGRHSSRIPVEDCFFYFRSINNQNEMTAEELAGYAEGKVRQDGLKAWIKSELGEKLCDHATEYRAAWNAEKRKIDETSLKALADIVRGQLKASIEQELAEKTQEDDPELETTVYLNVKRENTVERTEVKQIVDFALGETGSGLLVTGVPGSGKSTLMAQVQEKLETQARNGRCHVITHVAGLDFASSSVTGMMEHFSRQLESLLNIPYENVAEGNRDASGILPQNGGRDGDERKSAFDLWKDRLSDLLNQASWNTRTVLLLDSADSLEKTEAAQWFEWLPESLPDNLRVIVTALPGMVHMPKWNGKKEIEFSGLPAEDVTHMLIQMAETQYGKGWNNEVLSLAEEKVIRAGGLPLYAQILVSHLMNITGDDIRQFKSEKSHIEWMIHELSRVPGTIDGLYSVLIERIRDSYGKEIADAILGIVAVTRSGIYERDLANAVFALKGQRLDDLTLLNIKGLLSGHLRQDRDNSWWDFEHQQMRRCLLESEVSGFDNIYQKQLHTSIVTGAINCAKKTDDSASDYLYTDFWASEFLWHCYCGDLIREASHWISGITEKCHSDKPEATILEIIDMVEHSGMNWLERVLDYADGSTDHLKTYQLALSVASDLSHQNQFAEAISLYEKFYTWVEKTSETNPEYLRDVAATQNNLGSLYSITGNKNNAEVMFLAALKTMEGLAEQDPDAYLPGLASSQFNLGLFLYETSRLEKAEDKLLAGFKIMKALAKENPTEYLPELSLMQNTLGILYKNTGRMKESEEILLASLESIKLLSEKNSAYLAGLADMKNNIGNLYKETFRMEDAEGMYRAALEIQQSLCEKNPAAYMPRIAMTQLNLGILYKITNRMTEAEEVYKTALETYKLLAEKYPAIYLQHVAGLSNNLGSLYHETSRMTDAEIMCLEALKIYNALAEENPEVYLHDVATTQNNLGVLYSETHRIQDEEEMFLMALETYKVLAEKNPESYLPDVTKTQVFLGIIYYRMKRMKEAEELYLAALEIKKALAEVNPAAYLSDVAGIQNNLGILYYETSRLKDAEEMYLVALETRKALVKNNPSASSLLDVAVTQNYLGIVYSETNRMKESKEMCQAALTIYKILHSQNYHDYSKTILGIELKLEILDTALNEEKEKQRNKEKIHTATFVKTTYQATKSEDVMAKRFNEYKKQMEAWEALPWRKKITTKKPKQPKDVY